MLEVYIALIIAEKLQKMLTTQFWPLDTELIRELNSGILKTLGEPPGVAKDTSKCREEPTCALLLNVTHIP
jgi:hypothetical protein